MNVGNRLSQTFIVIRHADHASAQAENTWHGGQHFRYLNVTGRWAANGTTAVPLLSWRTVEEAAAAAVIASDARQTDIRCSSIGGDSYDERHFAPFGKNHAAALLGYLPYDTTKARKLAEQRAKTLDFARSVLRVHRGTTNEQAKQLEVSEGRSLVQKYRTTVYGARQYLTGKKATEILGMIESGDLEEDEELSVADLQEAVQTAIRFDTEAHGAAEVRTRSSEPHADR